MLNISSNIQRKGLHNSFFFNIPMFNPSVKIVFAYALLHFMRQLPMAHIFFGIHLLDPILF
ncbi:hypothetical protein HanIR_Chr07g0326001 [Helianthus annuus]|nr:hypothetical protein HanIR_Chr07g0326001 [Helianthus annuus]